MQILNYLKQNGIKHTLQVIYQYKIEMVLEKLVSIFTKHQPLKNIIVIESHNDFDCNGGAFYDYLIKNEYNKKYKIIWLVRKKVKKKLPDNVSCLWLFKPGFRKAFYICTAKFFTSDSDITNKARKDQISIYFTHGAVALKDCKGYCDLPDSVDFVLFPKDDLHSPVLADQYNIEYPSKKILHLGYPIYDVLCSPSENELKKIVKGNYKYNKVILWMPTFRKGIAFQRNDSNIEQKMGIPLIETDIQYNELNQYLKDRNILMVIKLHPKQDISKLDLRSLSNIIVLTADNVKSLEIDNYRLMKDADALISDYSSSLYAYLILNRPVGYVFSDLKDYKLGLCVKNLEDYIAGKIITNYEEFISFIENIYTGEDGYLEKRKELSLKLFDYVDTNNCKRVAEFLKL